jgi:hypothetical protein
MNGWIRGEKESLLLEEDTDTVPTQLIAVLEEQTLMDTFLRMQMFPLALCLECGYEQGIRGARDIDITVLLDEAEGFLVFANGDLREFE